MSKWFNATRASYIKSHAAEHGAELKREGAGGRERAARKGGRERERQTEADRDRGREGARASEREGGSEREGVMDGGGEI